MLQSPATTEIRPGRLTNELADVLAAVEHAARSNGAQSMKMASQFLADHALQLLQDAGVDLLHATEQNTDLVWLDHFKRMTTKEDSGFIETLSLARPEDRSFIAFLPIHNAVSCMLVPRGASHVSSLPAPKIGLPELEFRELTFELQWEHFSFNKQISGATEKELCAQIVGERWLLFSGVILGMVQRTFEYVLDYARKRTTFGKAIGHHQAVGLKLADIAIALESCRLLCQQACVSGNKGAQFFHQACDIWQYVKATIKDIAPQSMQVMGGHGYLQRYPVQQWFCDLQLLLLAGEMPDSFMSILQYD